MKMKQTTLTLRATGAAARVASRNISTAPPVKCTCIVELVYSGHFLHYTSKIISNRNVNFFDVRNSAWTFVVDFFFVVDGTSLAAVICPNIHRNPVVLLICTVDGTC
jgi:hypothetical protein